jgi:hypothetical protein
MDTGSWNNIILLGHTLEVYDVGANGYCIRVFPLGGFEPVFKEYLETAELARNAGIVFVTDDANDQLNEFGYEVIEKED